MIPERSLVARKAFPRLRLADPVPGNDHDPEPLEACLRDRSFEASTFALAERAPRVCSPAGPMQGCDVGRPRGVTLPVALSFFVSRDEEHVELRATLHGREHDLGVRGHNYLLLTLARRRLADAAHGLSDTTCGWVYTDALSRDPTTTLPRLNVDVFRIRKQFERIGLAGALGIIERRKGSGQIRIGTALLAITRL